MTANFLLADWILCGLGIAFAVLGLFRGFSGTLAFLLASVAAFVVGNLGWIYSAQYVGVVWQRAGLTLVAVLLSYGIVRLIVKKLVNGLLRQPTDALLGMIVGVVFAVLVVGVWAWSGLYPEYSYLVQEAAVYVR